MSLHQKVVLILQARMGSTRLPGKSLLKICDKPLIEHIIDRVKFCKEVDEIILATPLSDENDELAKFADKKNITSFRGSEDDVLNRYYCAAKNSNADLVVRIPADNAVPEASEIDKIIRHHISLNRPGFSSNLCEVFNSGYPDGIGAEVFDFKLLADAELSQADLKKREHPHLNFFDYESQTPVDPKWCPISTIKCPEEFAIPDLILDVNTKEQYKFIKSLYNCIYPSKPNFTIYDVVKWYKNYNNEKK